MLKVAVLAAAAELLCLTGESADGAMPLNGNDKDPWPPSASSWTKLRVLVFRRRYWRCR
jgi:hypothetical protein